MPKAETSISTKELEVIVNGAEPRANDPLGLWNDSSNLYTGELILNMYLNSGDLWVEPISLTAEKEKSKKEQVAARVNSPQLQDRAPKAKSKKSQTLVGALRLDDTAEVDMISELGADSIPVFGDSAIPLDRSEVSIQAYRSIAERSYINLPKSNPFPKPRIEEFEDLIFGLPELADEARVERDITEEDTQEIPIVKINDNPKHPAYNTPGLLDLQTRWSDSPKQVEDESLTAVRKRLSAIVESAATAVRKSFTVDPLQFKKSDSLEALQKAEEKRAAKKDSQKISDIKNKVVLIAKTVIQQIDERSRPLLAEGAAPSTLEEPIPMTPEAIVRDRLRVARTAAALGLAASFLAPESAWLKQRKAKQKLMQDPTSLEVQGVGKSGLAALPGSLAALGVMPGLNLTDAHPSTQLQEAGSAKIEKQFVQSRGVLVYPENLVKNELGYAQLPDNEALYRFFNLQDYGEFGVGNGETCEVQRFGHRDLIGVINTTALAWHAAHPNEKLRLMIADLNADGHASHMRGIDFDLYMEDDSIRWNSSGYKKDRAIEIGKIMLETDRVKLMFFNDPDVIVALNNYAREKGLSGVVEYAKNHDAHFHVRINNEPGPESAPGCETTKPESKITIPWMNDGVMELAPYINESSKEFGVDPDLVAIVTYIETKGKLGLDSAVGAVGPMQVMPDTGRELARELGLRNYDLRDPKTNIRLGTYYLSKLLKEYGNASHAPTWDMSALLAAIGYNGGPGAANGYLKGEVVRNQGPFCESRRYGYFALGMWRERHSQTSKFFEEYNKAVNHCKTDPNSFPITSLK